MIHDPPLSRRIEIVLVHVFNRVKFKVDVGVKMSAVSSPSLVVVYCALLILIAKKITTTDSTPGSKVKTGTGLR